MLPRFFSLLLGYFLGCILTAEIISYRKTGKSIRSMGTGNPGMTNALRLFGTKAGVLVLLGDLGKTVLACLLAAFLSAFHAELPNGLAIFYAGFGTVLGHNYPFWNGFHGGKGVACTCMALFCFSPGFGLLACCIGLGVTLLTHYLPIGAIIIPLAFFVISLFLPYSLEVRGLALLLTLIMFLRHFPALKQIYLGNEKKSLWWER